MNNGRHTIKIGISSKDYIAINNLNRKKSIDAQPAGLNFYDTDWPQSAQGIIYLDNGDQSIEFNHVIGVTGTENVDFLDQGISDFDIRAMVNDVELTDHDKVRNYIFSLLEKLIDAGWLPYISPSMPRLSGEHGMRYITEKDGLISPPIDYRPSLEEWMGRNFSGWKLYANGAFMTISLRRDSSRMVIDQPGAYFMAISIESELTFAKGHFESDDRENWQELWPETIANLKKERYKIERELLKDGYKIDTDYIEPIIHPADPVEP